MWLFPRWFLLSSHEGSPGGLVWLIAGFCKGCCVSLWSRGQWLQTVAVLTADLHYWAILSGCRQWPVLTADLHYWAILSGCRQWLCWQQTYITVPFSVAADSGCVDSRLTLLGHSQWLQTVAVLTADLHCRQWLCWQQTYSADSGCVDSGCRQWLCWQQTYITGPFSVAADSGCVDSRLTLLGHSQWLQTVAVLTADLHYWAIISGCRQWLCWQQTYITGPFSVAADSGCVDSRLTLLGHYQWLQTVAVLTADLHYWAILSGCRQWLCWQQTYITGPLSVAADSGCVDSRLTLLGHSQWLQTVAVLTADLHYWAIISGCRQWLCWQQTYITGPLSVAADSGCVDSRLTLLGHSQWLQTVAVLTADLHYWAILSGCRQWLVLTADLHYWAMLSGCRQWLLLTADLHYWAILSGCRQWLCWQQTYITVPFSVAADSGCVDSRLTLLGHSQWLQTVAVLTADLHYWAILSGCRQWLCWQQTYITGPFSVAADSGCVDSRLTLLGHSQWLQTVAVLTADLHYWAILRATGGSLLLLASSAQSTWTVGVHHSLSRWYSSHTGQTDTKPTSNRQKSSNSGRDRFTVGIDSVLSVWCRFMFWQTNLSGRDLSNMFERSLRDKLSVVCRSYVGVMSVLSGSVWGHVGLNWATDGRWFVGVKSVMYRAYVGRPDTNSRPIQDRIKSDITPNCMESADTFPDQN